MLARTNNNPSGYGVVPIRKIPDLILHISDQSRKLLPKGSKKLETCAKTLVVSEVQGGWVPIQQSKE